MHDLDRTQEESYDEYSGFEFEAGDYEFEDEYELEADDYELEGEYEFEDEYEDEFEDEYEDEDELEYYSGEVFSEAEELELAAELLEVTEEHELDQFIGKLFKRAARKIKKKFKRPIFRKLGGFVKGFAKKALPKLGALAGNYFLPGIGGKIGRKLGSKAGKILGLELEGLSPEDQEFEIAKRIVRLGGEAAKQAAVRNNMPSKAAAKVAMVKAAQKHAPGLVGKTSKRPSYMPSGKKRSGRWVRRGSKIVIYGL